MPRPMRKDLSEPSIYTVIHDGEPIVVDSITRVDFVPDDAPVLMQAGNGALRMYAAAKITSLPLDLMFPVYVESDDMASLVPVESALRRAQWVVPEDSILNDQQFVNGLSKSKTTR